MSQFIESVKIEDKKIFLTHLHQKRMDETFANYGRVCKIDIYKLFLDLKHQENGLFKFRIEYDLDNNYKTQIIPYIGRELKNFELIIDHHIHYDFKSKDRKRLQELKNKSLAEEIIIVKENKLTDTSYSNLIFLNNKTWYTPKSYLLNGVMRQHLLLSKKIKEMDVTVNDVNIFSHFQMINALNDFDNMFIYPIQKIINLPKRSPDFYF